MERIRVHSFEVPEGTVGYLFAKPDEIKHASLKEGEVLEKLEEFKPGDTLLFWYRDPWDRDDDFDTFKVFPEEEVYRIKISPKESK